MTVTPRLFRLFSLSALGLLASGPGLAGIIYGNPTSKIVLDSGSPVEIGAVTAYACPGSASDAVDDTLTSSGALYATLPAGAWCDLYVEVLWSGESTWDDVQVTGFTGFETDAGEPQRTIRLYPSSRTAVLE